MISPHQQLKINSPLLDKLWQRRQNTQKIADQILTSGSWTNYDKEVAKPLDKELKAFHEYQHQLDVELGLKPKNSAVNYG